MITKFISVAEACLRLGNMYSLFSIVGALTFPQVLPSSYFQARTSKQQQEKFILEHAPISTPHIAGDASQARMEARA